MSFPAVTDVPVGQPIGKFSPLSRFHTNETPEPVDIGPYHFEGILVADYLMAINSLDENKNLLLANGAGTGKALLQAAFHAHMSEVTDSPAQQGVSICLSPTDSDVLQEIEWLEILGCKVVTEIVDAEGNYIDPNDFEQGTVVALGAEKALEWMDHLGWLGKDPDGKAIPRVPVTIDEFQNMWQDPESPLAEKANRFVDSVSSGAFGALVVPITATPGIAAVQVRRVINLESEEEAMNALGMRKENSVYVAADTKITNERISEMIHDWAQNGQFMRRENQFQGQIKSQTHLGDDVIIPGLGSFTQAQDAVIEHYTAGDGPVSAEQQEQMRSAIDQLTQHALAIKVAENCLHHIAGGRRVVIYATHEEPEALQAVFPDAGIPSPAQVIQNHFAAVLADDAPEAAALREAFGLPSHEVHQKAIEDPKNAEHMEILQAGKTGAAGPIPHIDPDIHGSAQEHIVKTFKCQPGEHCAVVLVDTSKPYGLDLHPDQEGLPGTVLEAVPDIKLCREMEQAVNRVSRYGNQVAVQSTIHRIEGSLANEKYDAVMRESLNLGSAFGSQIAGHLHELLVGSRGEKMGEGAGVCQPQVQAPKRPLAMPKDLGAGSETLEIVA